jgi:diaminohydroxyphosphoribosylaminopyrimidine deaminase/5-amino-6-(5-phosphoribosylamino)uracil reductase
MTLDHRHFMEIALDLAARGCRYTSPNPMVGAVVVKHSTIVGSGYHELVGGPHAEVNAINDAGDQARGATLYVTLEPCNHTGRTPPCTEKVLSAGIEKVVSAMDDPNPGVAGGGNAFLASKGVKIVRGICEDRARRLNEAYITFVQTKKPFVVLKCAATLDGRIATRTGDSKWISNELSRQFVHRLRHESDAILVGIGTVKADDPRLTTRLSGQVFGKSPRDPLRIVLDTKLSISETASVLRVRSDSDTIIVTGPMEGHPERLTKKKRLQNQGVKVMECPVKNRSIDLRALMGKLGSLNITRLLVEGGSKVLASALAEGIADKVMFFYAPKILGADDGAPVCSGPGPAFMAQSHSVRDIRVQQFGEDVMIEGYVHQNRRG